jgi:hypothetical protein
MKKILYICILISGIFIYDQENGNYMLYCNTNSYSDTVECYKGNA